MFLLSRLQESGQVEGRDPDDHLRSEDPPLPADHPLADLLGAYIDAQAAAEAPPLKVAAVERSRQAIRTANNRKGFKAVWQKENKEWLVPCFPGDGMDIATDVRENPIVANGDSPRPCMYVPSVHPLC